MKTKRPLETFWKDWNFYIRLQLKGNIVRNPLGTNQWKHFIEQFPQLFWNQFQHEYTEALHEEAKKIEEQLEQATIIDGQKNYLRGKRDGILSLKPPLYSPKPKAKK